MNWHQTWTEMNLHFPQIFDIFIKCAWRISIFQKKTVGARPLQIRRQS